MRLIEADVSGVRTAIVRLRSLGARCTYTLVPMLPVCEQGYIDELKREIERHDVLLCETFDHPLDARMTEEYAKLAASPRIKLILSRAVLGVAVNAGKEVTNIGASAEDFGTGSEFRQHWMVRLIRRVILTWVGWVGDRMDLLNNLYAVDRGASREFHALRRRSLQANLQRFHETVVDRPISIAVLVALDRMTVVTHHLIERHYFDGFQTRWVTVFRWATPGVPRARAWTEALSRRSERKHTIADPESGDRAFVKARFKARRERWILINTTRGLFQLLLRAGIGAAIAATIYFGWLSFKTLPYRWEDMDWNDDGRVTLGEFLKVGGTDIREVVRNQQLCVEVFSRQDGNILKSHCYP
jgi:hypothetical protein